MTVILTIKAQKQESWKAPADKRLALLLKAMKRAYGFECTSVKEVSEQEPATPLAGRLKRHD